MLKWQSVSLQLPVSKEKPNRSSALLTIVQFTSDPMANVSAMSFQTMAETANETISHARYKRTNHPLALYERVLHELECSSSVAGRLSAMKSYHKIVERIGSKELLEVETPYTVFGFRVEFGVLAEYCIEVLTEMQRLDGRLPHLPEGSLPSLFLTRPHLLQPPPSAQNRAGDVLKAAGISTPIKVESSDSQFLITTALWNLHGPCTAPNMPAVHSPSSLPWDKSSELPANFVALLAKKRQALNQEIAYFTLQKVQEYQKFEQEITAQRSKENQVGNDDVRRNILRAHWPKIEESFLECARSHLRCHMYPLYPTYCKPPHSTGISENKTAEYGDCEAGDRWLHLRQETEGLIKGFWWLWRNSG